MDILSIIVITLTIAIIFNIFLKRFQISSIVGYILTGSIIGYFMGFSQITQNELSHIAEFGIVFLMFTIGLEFSLHHLKQMKKEVFVFGGLQVVLVSSFFGFVAHHFFGIDVKTSIILGAAISLSSTAIVLKILNENGDIHRPYGRNSVGILIFQDLAVIPILIMITIFTDQTSSLNDLVTNTIISGAIVLGTLYFVGKFVVEKLLAIVVDSKSEELFVGTIILLVLSSALLAHLFGFSYSLGAFIAGMLIAETKYKYQIEADLVPFRDILLGLFFITVGMQVNIHYVIDNLLNIIGLTVGILLVKLILIFALISIFNIPKRAFKTALTLAQVGEFSFAVLAVAASSNLLSNDVHQMMLSSIIISLIFTSIALKYVRQFSDIFFIKKSELLEEPIVSAEISNHIIVCGYSLLGQKIVKKLKQENITYIAIEHDRNHVKRGHDVGDIVFFGNAASKTMLNSVGIKNAMAVIIAIDNDDKVRLITEAIKSIDSKIEVIVKISHQAQIDDLSDLDVKNFVNENEIVASELIKKATTCTLPIH
ncbi:MAG: cation:proton antiporter [Arcobacteraceae bacterium]|nr:cation:proton antiporter [Arcobacteraceae bacterium]